MSTGVDDGTTVDVSSVTSDGTAAATAIAGVEGPAGDRSRGRGDCDGEQGESDERGMHSERWFEVDRGSEKWMYG